MYYSILRDYVPFFSYSLLTTSKDRLNTRDACAGHSRQRRLISTQPAPSRPEQGLRELGARSPLTNWRFKERRLFGKWQVPPEIVENIYTAGKASYTAGAYAEAKLHSWKLLRPQKENLKWRCKLRYAPVCPRASRTSVKTGVNEPWSPHLCLKIIDPLACPQLGSDCKTPLGQGACEHECYRPLEQVRIMIAVDTTGVNAIKAGLPDLDAMEPPPFRLR